MKWFAGVAALFLVTTLNQSLARAEDEDLKQALQDVEKSSPIEVKERVPAGVNKDLPYPEDELKKNEPENFVPKADSTKDLPVDTD